MEIAALHTAHVTAAKQATQATKMFQRRLWYKRIQVAHGNLLHNPCQFWRWASMTTRWNLKASAAGIQPVRDQEGVLQTTLPGQLAVWRTHFAMLASDPTRNSQDPGKWRNIATDQTLPALTGLDADFCIADVWQALQGMKTHRAPGGNGIPTNFYWSALKEKQGHEEWVKAKSKQNGQGDGSPELGRGFNFGSSDEELQTSSGGARDGGAEDRTKPPIATDEQEPSLFMTMALLDLLNCAWSTGTVVDDWVESIVVSLPKKGDLTNPGNYRGILLMSTLFGYLAQ